MGDPAKIAERARIVALEAEKADRLDEIARRVEALTARMDALEKRDE